MGQRDKAEARLLGFAHDQRRESTSFRRERHPPLEEAEALKATEEPEVPAARREVHRRGVEVRQERAAAESCANVRREASVG